MELSLEGDARVIASECTTDLLRYCVLKIGCSAEEL